MHKSHQSRVKEVDWETIKKLAAMQCTTEEIASFFGFSRQVLYRAAIEVYDRPIKELLDEWRLGGHCSLRRNQWKLAEKNAAMAIFLGKQYLGQIDDFKMRHSGDVGIQVVHYGDEEPQQWSGSSDLEDGPE